MNATFYSAVSALGFTLASITTLTIRKQRRALKITSIRKDLDVRLFGDRSLLALYTVISCALAYSLLMLLLQLVYTTFFLSRLPFLVDSTLTTVVTIASKYGVVDASSVLGSMFIFVLRSFLSKLFGKQRPNFAPLGHRLFA